MCQPALGSPHSCALLGTCKQYHLFLLLASVMLYTGVLRLAPLRLAPAVMAGEQLHSHTSHPFGLRMRHGQWIMLPIIHLTVHHSHTRTSRLPRGGRGPTEGAAEDRLVWFLAAIGETLLLHKFRFFTNLHDAMRLQYLRSASGLATRLPPLPKDGLHMPGFQES